VGGGLGNQLFQYAAGRTLSLRTGEPLVYNTAHLTNDPIRDYELDIFNTAGRLMNRLEAFRVRYSESVKLAPLRRIAPWPALQVFRDRDIGFNPAFNDLGGNVFLKGNFQSEKYFQSAAAEIRRDLTFRRDPDERNQQMISQIGGVTAVAVHVRRGDIAANPYLHSRHGLCDLDYYRVALDHVTQRVAGATFFVFSDDPAWTRENLRVPEPAIFVSHNTGKRNFEDLRLMTQCRHFIIANSTFSWWGAWLSQSPGKIVVAPRKWFADASISDKDLIPDAWVRL
jgi:hypothetical protein